MEQEGLLPCSQQPSIGHYPEPDPVRTNPYYLRKIYFNIIHPTMCCLRSGLFPSCLHTNIIFFPILATFPIYLILLDLNVLLISC
jgi:hypothetical protein